MATVKKTKIKKAQNGALGFLKGCNWDRGERSSRTSLAEKLANLRGDIATRREERQARREERRRPSMGNDEGFERDFPEGGAAPGLWGETKGSKDTRWKSEGGSMKKGGKVVKKSAVKKSVVKKVAVKKAKVGAKIKSKKK